MPFHQVFERNVTDVNKAFEEALQAEMEHHVLRRFRTVI